MRLIVQIPYLNGADTLPAVVQDVPQQLPGFGEFVDARDFEGKTPLYKAIERPLNCSLILAQREIQKFTTNMESLLETCLTPIFAER